MNYVDAINQVLNVEKGFVNHPNDRGGPTNFGITQKVYETFKGRSVSLVEMMNMPKADAIAIYKKNYWDKIGGDKIKLYSVAYAIFDQAVNRGVSAAIKQAQKIAGVLPDGLAGPTTLNAINAIFEGDFLKKYFDESLRAYESIVNNDPTQKTFLNGWRNRVSHLIDYTSKYLGSLNRSSIGIGVLLLVSVIFFLIFRKK